MRPNRRNTGTNISFGVVTLTSVEFGRYTSITGFYILNVFSEINIVGWIEFIMCLVVYIFMRRCLCTVYAALHRVHKSYCSKCKTLETLLTNFRLRTSLIESDPFM